jgi:hypothetical protein
VKFLKFIFKDPLMRLQTANLVVLIFNLFTRWPGYKMALIYCNMVSIGTALISWRQALKARRKWKAAVKDHDAFKQDLKQYEFFYAQAVALQAEHDEAEKNFDASAAQDAAMRCNEACKRAVQEIQILAKKYPQNVQVKMEKIE